MRSTLDPTLDIVFKMLFAAPGSRDTLIALLTAVLRPASPISQIQVLNPEITRDQVDDKGIALDIHVVLADGRRLDVEMQADKRPAFRDRALYYWSRIFGSQLERGQPYTALHPVVSVLFLDYVELEGQRFHSTFRLLEERDHVLFTNHLAIHLIELPKRARISDTDRQSEADLLSWTRFLGAKTDDEVTEACMSNPTIAKANQILEHLSATPSAQELARQRKLALDTYRIELAAVKEEGKTEGRVEGRVEGRAGTLLEQLRMKFGPLDDRLMSRIQNGTEDDLQRWTRRILTASTLQEFLGDG